MMMESGCQTKPWASGQYHQSRKHVPGRPNCVPANRHSLLGKEESVLVPNNARRGVYWRQRGNIVQHFFLLRDGPSGRHENRPVGSVISTRMLRTEREARGHRHFGLPDAVRGPPRVEGTPLPEFEQWNEGGRD